MALPTVTDLKSYLRIEVATEDALLAQLLTRAQALLEGWIDVPIPSTAQSAIDRATSLAQPVTSLVYPRRPITVTSIVDMDGATVPSTDYWVDGTSGVIYAVDGVTFPFGPYTITVQCGLALRQDYARLEPLLAEAILDLAADLYQRRTPGATSEKAGDTTVTWDASRDTVARVMKSLRMLKLGVMT